MTRVTYLYLVAISLISTVSPAPLSTSPNPAITAHNFLLKRAELGTGDDDFPDTEPHPNKLDQVKTAFSDAFELVSYVLKNIDDDSTIFPHYFNNGDRNGVKDVFLRIVGTTEIPENPTTGNDLLSNIHVQREDIDDRNPLMVLCDNAIKKKAVTPLKGAKAGDPKWYTSCKTLKKNGHVSYLINTLGATILQEYTHFNGPVEAVFGDTIDDQTDAKGYSIGYRPVQVYDKLDKSLAPFNADSYTYYAIQNLWSILCAYDFKAPRPGKDDADPDCDGEACQS
ncbi:MAG: hypothetical protein Q9221_005696 [Calogaya cf. arnoldii]